jgi:hypothetical protein
MIHYLYNEKSDYFCSLDYSRVEANPPHRFTKVEAVAQEAVVNYCKRATTKAL